MLTPDALFLRCITIRQNLAVPFGLVALFIFQGSAYFKDHSGPYWVDFLKETRTNNLSTICCRSVCGAITTRKIERIFLATRAKAALLRSTGKL